VAARERALTARISNFFQTKSFRNVATALIATSLCTLIAWMLYPTLDLVNIALLYMLGCAWSSIFLGRLASVLATFTSVLEYDFLFVPPRFSIEVYDWHYIMTFMMMAIVSMLISELAFRSRMQLVLAQERADRLRALYEFSRDLASRRALGAIFSDLVERARVEIGVEARVESPAPELAESALNTPLSQEVGIDALAPSVDEGTGDLRVPIIAGGKTIACLVVESSGKAVLARPEQCDLLCSFAGLTSLVVERTLLAEAAERNQREIEKQEIRNLMLSSISHDLRTPMTVIIGSAQSLSEEGDHLDRDTAQQLLDGILRESQRMSDLLNSILEISWLDSGMIAVNRSWNDLEELLGAALKSLCGQLAGREVRLDLQEDLPLVKCDAVLISQVIGNLLDNASKHTPANGPVEVRIKVSGMRLFLGVLDSGPGIPVDAEEKVFEKFFRVHPETRGAGTGLGLAICRTIIALHGGEISAESRSGGGAAFWFWLPIEANEPFRGDE
jgi:two-component system sensor histidine kinase KdpD